MNQADLYNFIDDTQRIDFPVPDAIREMCDLAEQADHENNFGLYLAYADHIDVMCKNAYAAGCMSERQWETMCMRYNQQ